MVQENTKIVPKGFFNAVFMWCKFNTKVSQTKCDHYQGSDKFSICHFDSYMLTKN